MSSITTPVTKAMAFDVQGFAPQEVVPEALLNLTSTRVGFVEGDEPSVRVPYVGFDDDAGFVAEGADIPEADPDYSEAVIYTGKIAVLARVSREQMSHNRASEIVSSSMRNAIVRKANAAYLAQVAPTPPAVTPPAGLLNLAPTAGGTLGTDLDKLIEALATIEAASGTPSHFIASPDAWSTLSKLKAATGSNVGLIGAGVEAAERRLLGVPVLVSSAMTAKTILALDKDAVLSASGELQVAVSEDAYFGSDSVGVRVTWRFGQTIADVARVVKVTMPSS